MGEIEEGDERGDRRRRARQRVGVVLLVPAPFDREIDALRRGVGDGARERVPPHLTLVPPINVRDDEMGDVLALLRSAAARVDAIDVTLGPPATFLPHNPVVYLAVAGPGADAVHELHEALSAGPLAREPTWPFVPHVTLADQATPERIDAVLHALVDYEVRVRFDRVHLLEEGGDRVWRPIAEAPLARPAVVGRGGIALELTVTARLDVEASRWSTEEWDLHHAGATSPVDLAVTARRDGVVVATATGWTRGDLANLSELIVSAGVRGEGVGSHLMGAFLSEAAARGATRCRLRADAGSPAEAFYRARGWREEARYPGPSGDVDIVQLVRSL